MPNKGWYQRKMGWKIKKGGKAVPVVTKPKPIKDEAVRVEPTKVYERGKIRFVYDPDKPTEN